MLASVDIPTEVILEALQHITKKEGICEVLPNARFHLLGKMFSRDTKWSYGGLVCGHPDPNRNTGFGVTLCENCSQFIETGDKDEREM